MRFALRAGLRPYEYVPDAFVSFADLEQPSSTLSAWARAKTGSVLVVRIDQCFPSR